MNTLAKSSRFTLAASFFAPLALMLSACGNEPAVPVEPPLYGATIGGEFDLQNTSGEAVKWADFNGRYRIVYFGYAYCPDICPTDVQRTVQGLNQFTDENPELGEQVQPIFISIDPDRDTPEVVEEFTNAFSERLIGLTGSPEQIADAAKTFGVYYTKLDSPSPDTYLMDHSRTVLLFGPQGEPLALLPADLGADAVAEELGKWVT
ncbi:SCO family protein [Erythrobacter sp. KY5]|uniref:SCO family protein n=1 Tax=Erythrobacter sp. KY5 TaxID=2011159 RepID=UPI000DBF09B9|nr:SCO family protein [Erythrobacter sp. KY5]AWW73709.1 SCO family protein [Erythrobacter sp. KY5]